MRANDRYVTGKKLSREAKCVSNKKSAYILPVMPVPDQVRDDGSGIQKPIDLKLLWIPGQARNDKTVGRASVPACI
jgi:hypothetical protein